MAISRTANFNGTASTWDTTNWSDFFSASGFLLNGSGYAVSQGANAGSVYDSDTNGNDQYSIARGSYGGTGTALMGPVVRASGTGASANGYHAGIDYTNQHLYLRKCINGSWSAVDDVAVSIDTEGTVGLYVIGSTLHVVVDSVLVLTATDTSIPSGGYAGIFSASNPANTFHYWRGGDIPDSPVLAGWQDNGWTTSSTSPGSSGGRIHWATNCTVVMRSGTVEEVSFDILGWSGASNVRAAVYRASDRALLGLTASTSTAGLTVPGTVTLDITTPFAVTAGDVIIICWWCDTGYQSVPGVSDEGCLLLGGETYPTYPDPLPAHSESSGNAMSAIYVSGTPGGGTGPSITDAGRAYTGLGTIGHGNGFGYKRF